MVACTPVGDVRLLRRVALRCVATSLERRPLVLPPVVYQRAARGRQARLVARRRECFALSAVADTLGCSWVWSSTSRRPGPGGRAGCCDLLPLAVPRKVGQRAGVPQRPCSARFSGAMGPGGGYGQMAWPAPRTSRCLSRRTGARLRRAAWRWLRCAGVVVAHACNEVGLQRSALRWDHGGRQWFRRRSAAATPALVSGRC